MKGRSYPRGFFVAIVGFVDLCREVHKIRARQNRLQSNGDIFFFFVFECRGMAAWKVRGEG